MNSTKQVEHYRLKSGNRSEYSLRNTWDNILHSDRLITRYIDNPWTAEVVWGKCFSSDFFIP